MQCVWRFAAVSRRLRLSKPARSTILASKPWESAGCRVTGMIYERARVLMVNHCVRLAIILSMTTLFLLPALDNGFPFVFADTGGYLIGIAHPVFRSTYYTIFNRIFDLRWSPWPGIVIQSLACSWTIWCFSSSLFNINDPFRLLVLALFLVFGTSLPWFVGWVMADIFTPLMIIALALLCFADDKLSRLSEIMLVSLLAAALAFHQANLPVALWLLPGLGLCALLGWRPSGPFLRGLLASSVGLTLGIAALLVMNLLFGRIGLSNSGSLFLLARMLEDGTAISYLEQACPRQHFVICAELNELKSYNTLNPSPKGCLSCYFLWNGPLERLGGFPAEEAEASAIVRGTLFTNGPAQLRAAIDNGWRQFVLFSTGAELNSYSDGEYVSTAIWDRFGSAVYRNYRHSKQIRGVLDFFLINRVHTTVIIACSFLLIVFLISTGIKARPRSFYATIVMIALVTGNAFTLGALSGPSDRYQGRVIWLIPLLAACFVLERLPYPQLRNRGALSA
jgi:hypothetical protein